MSILYIVFVAAANILAGRFGPDWTPLIALGLIGPDLTIRDYLHEKWQGSHLFVRMALLIATGSVISYFINRSYAPVAIASFVAFAAASTGDALVYQLLRNNSPLTRINTSNIVSAAIDSVVFPTIAFGEFRPWVIVFQFAAKVLGGFVWAFLIERNRNRRTVPVS